MQTDLADKLRQLKLDTGSGRSGSARAPLPVPSAGFKKPLVERGRGRRLGVIGGMAGTAVLAFSAGLFLDDARGPTPPTQSPSVAAASPAKPAPIGFAASGHIVARRQATIAAQTTGMIESIAVEEGQRVAKGALIARLDDRVLVAHLASAEATAVAASAEIDGLTARRQAAMATEARFATLAERGFARRADLDEARAELGAVTAEIRRARAQRASRSAETHAASVSLDRTSIRAPFGGIVTRLSAQPGEIISPVSAGGGFTRTGICTIVDMDSLEVEVDVSEMQIARVATGQLAEITLQAYPEHRYRGRVLAVVPVADRARASFRVRVAIDRTDGRILPEMAARVFFTEKA